MADKSTKDQITTIMTELKACYDKTDDSGKDYKKMYIEDTDSYRTNSMSEIIENTVVDAFRNIAYYNYLNAFEVNYVTDDLGYPIEYVESGKYDEKGEPIKVAVRITKYNPDRYIRVKADMGTPATLVQKMHKDLLTGEDYTEEEIEKLRRILTNRSILKSCLISNHSCLTLSREILRIPMSISMETKSMRLQLPIESIAL